MSFAYIVIIIITTNIINVLLLLLSLPTRTIKSYYSKSYPTMKSGINKWELWCYISADYACYINTRIENEKVSIHKHQ